MSQPRFELVYWPIAFRGCFISYVLAYWDVPFVENADHAVIVADQHKDPSEQAIPCMGPPVLVDHEAGLRICQTPAILQYLASELQLAPEQAYARAMEMKVIMDCNDLLMELCCSNGSRMWEEEAWRVFRSKRLPRWLGIFEQSMAQGFIAGQEIRIADVVTCALLGNMGRCLPELVPDLKRGAPALFGHCQSLMAKPSLRAHIEAQTQAYGSLYCGGQIEASIREMLALL